MALPSNLGIMQDSQFNTDKLQEHEHRVQALHVFLCVGSED